MRGIYSANYLLRLTENFARKNGSQSIDLGKQFDLVTGTSTGAFIACGLAAGIDLEKIVNMYLEYGKQIFRLQLPHGSRGIVLMRLVKDILCRGKYLAEGTSSLRKALPSWRQRDATSIPGSIPFKTIRILSTGLRIVFFRFCLLMVDSPGQQKNQPE